MHAEAAKLEKKIAQTDTPLEKAKLLNQLSFMLHSYDKQASWNAIHHAAKEARMADDPEILAMSLWRLGVSSRAIGRMDDAIAHCEEALGIAREASLTLIHQGIINSLGVIYQQQGDFEKAMELYQESLALATAAQGKKNVAVIHANLGLLHVAKSSFREAFENYHHSIRLYAEIGETLPLNLFTNIAQLYLFTGNYKESLDYLLQALPMARQQQKVQIEATILTTIINVHYEFGQLEQAVSYIAEAAAFIAQAGEYATQVESFVEFSRVYADTGDFASARKYVERAEALTASTEIEYLQSQVLFAKGYIQYSQQQFQDALELYTQSIGILQTSGIMAGNKAIIFLSRALVYESLSEFNTALEDLHIAREIAEEINFANEVIRIYSHLARIYEKSGDTPQALHYYKKYSERKVQQLSEAAWYQTQNQLLRFDMEKAQQNAELLRLRNESLLKDSELQQQELKMLGRFFVQTSEIMQNIRQQAEVLKAQTAEETTKQLANKLLKYVKTTLTETDNRRTFEHTFEKTHGAFIQQLASDFPALTPTELRVSALLKTGLSTKEIASTLNLSTRTVEEHRGNIRRKMAIPAEIKLSAFFADYSIT
ncbi:MAG TPA: tetratricopeptide repeat protein, partial [Patescibacteria group bacterium]|nr:tetratricopeptide repeat protein [Patescibacteria group bacterium]